MLDGEVIALREDGRPHPFQVTGSRFGSRRNLDELRREIPLSVFFFDLLHLDGEDLLDAPLAERAAALDRLAPGAAHPARRRRGRRAAPRPPSTPRSPPATRA